MIYEQNLGLVIFFMVILIIIILYLIYISIKTCYDKKREKKLIEMMNLISKNNTPNM